MKNHGFTLLETTIVLAVIGLFASLAAPNLVRATSRTRVAAATAEIRAGLADARSTAVRFNANTALRFETSPAGTFCRVYRDGDGDGVLTADIQTGTDRPHGPLRQLGSPGFGVEFGFPPGARPRDPGTPGSRLRDLNDPIRFNRSNLASFDPFGSATPGSVYLTDGIAELQVVRVYGRTGRVRVLRWDEGADAWSER
jgi:prepilin-type N-terminal cleavage/methylation domain-containing protein